MGITLAEWNSIAPEFHGSPAEDPHKFLRACEDALAHLPRLSDVHRITLVTRQLRDGAAHWWSSYGRRCSYREFARAFEAKYSNEFLFNELRLQFYTLKQREDEPVDLFIRNKVQIAKRLIPGVSEQQLIRLITPTLHPDFRFKMSRHRFTELSRDKGNASDVDVDVAEASRVQRRRRAAPRGT